MVPFVHLHLHSPYSFLDGSSSLPDLVGRAAELGMSTIAMTDHNNVSTAVEFLKLARAAGIKPIQGAEVDMENGYHLVLLAQDPAGYANLCKILTEAHLGNPRGSPAVSLQTVEKHGKGLFALSGCRKGEIAAMAARNRHEKALEAARRYMAIFGRENFYVELQNSFVPRARSLNHSLAELARHLRIGLLATNNVHYACKQDFIVHDVLTCIRTLTKLDDVHPSRPFNGENHLKSPQEMAEIFTEYPEAIRNTADVAGRCQEVFIPGRQLFPRFEAPGGEPSGRFLGRLVYEGALERYGKITPLIAGRLEHELDVICRLGVEDYFLVMWDLVRVARDKGVRCAGRGSAADSAVAYCLRLTNVDSISRGLLFERFLSIERAQKPDIDIDFEAERRDDMAQYIYQRYGDDRVGSVCTFNTFHARSAIRDIAKAMGFPENEIDSLAKRFPHIPADAVRRAWEIYPELRQSGMPKEKYELLFDLCEAVAGLPRHIGTHLGGLVISCEPLTAVTPLQMAAKGVTITQFDKDSIEDLGLIKLDLLSLRTLSAVEDAMKTINRDGPRLDYDRIPLNDKPTYEMLNLGETVGVFQLESSAQRALQTRLGAENIEDLVASVALIRPGPIKGNMVEPFVARRRGLEPVTYIHPALVPILEKTYGVVLYQEQVIQIATAIAGFTPGEADRLRRVMTHYRSQKEMDAIGEDFVAKAIENGVPPDVARVIFSYIVGYAGYGFCEAHAAAFSDTAYRTAYLVKHHPAEFYAAILSHQPMGFYPPNTICVEARRRGIRILPPDINRSEECFTVEDGAIRVSLKQVKGMSGESCKRIVSERKLQGEFPSIYDFCSRLQLDRDALANLVLCGCFDTLHSNRKELLWRLPEIMEAAAAGRGKMGLGLLLSSLQQDSMRRLTDFSAFEKFMHEYRLLDLAPSTHLMSYSRSHLSSMGVVSSKDLAGLPKGRQVKVAGVVIRPHRPPTKSGRIVVFLTLEDEFGLIDVTVFENVYQRYGKPIFTSPALLVWGQVERRGNGVSVVARKVEALRCCCSQSSSCTTTPVP